MYFKACSPDRESLGTVFEFHLLCFAPMLKPVVTHYANSVFTWLSIFYLIYNPYHQLGEDSWEDYNVQIPPYLCPLPLLISIVCYSFGFFMNGSEVFYLTSSAYLYWILLWISFIKGIGLAAAELSNVSNYQSYHSKPRKMKNRKARQLKFPFYKRCYNRK